MRRAPFLGDSFVDCVRNLQALEATLSSALEDLQDEVALLVTRPGAFGIVRGGIVGGFLWWHDCCGGDGCGSGVGILGRWMKGLSKESGRNGRK